MTRAARAARVARRSLRKSARVACVLVTLGALFASLVHAAPAGPLAPRSLARGTAVQEPSGAAAPAGSALPDEGGRKERSPAEAGLREAARFAEHAAGLVELRRPEDARAALIELGAALQRAEEGLGIPPSARRDPEAFRPLGTAPAKHLREAAKSFERAAAALGEERMRAAREALEEGLDAIQTARRHDAWITDELSVGAVLLLALLAVLQASTHPRTRRLFTVLPAIAWAYFVPTALSNLGLLPMESPLYRAFGEYLLPACLVLLILAADLPAILRLGKPAVILFLAGSLGILIGAPLAYLATFWMLPAELGEETWKGLAALSGSWIGGGANFLAIGTATGAEPSTLSRMVVVDVLVGYVWMAVLLGFAAREKRMDARIDADRTALEEVRNRIARAPESQLRPADAADWLTLLAVAVGLTALARGAAEHLPWLGRKTWVVVLATSGALALSFTRVRRLEAVGASRLGTVALFLLIASIGAGASFGAALETPGFLLLGAIWMGVHAGTLFLVRRWLRAPVFFAAVGSMANVGGPASAPIVAAAFHPALAPVGALLAVFGLVLGTYAGLLLARVLEFLHGLLG